MLLGKRRRNLGCIGRVRLVEERPDLGFRPLPPVQPALVVRLLVAEPASYFLLTGLVRLDVQLVQDGQRCLEINKNTAIVIDETRSPLWAQHFR